MDLGSGNGHWTFQIAPYVHSPATLTFREGRLISDSDPCLGARPKNRPEGVILPGMSVAHKNRRAGTMGAMVYDQTEGYPMLLRCWHVIALPNAMSDSRVRSPGSSDGGQPESDWVGMLEKRGTFPNHLGDAAVARLVDKGVSGKPYVPGQFGKDDGSGKPIIVEQTHRITVKGLGEKVAKSGKATGMTEGVIDGVGLPSGTHPESIGFISEKTRKRGTIICQHLGCIKQTQGEMAASSPWVSRVEGEALLKCALRSQGCCEKNVIDLIIGLLPSFERCPFAP